MKVKVEPSCPAICNPMDCTVHGIQARILEWVAVPLERNLKKKKFFPRVLANIVVSFKIFS